VLSSGIGLVTAQMAAAKGARLVLAARQEDALKQLTNEVNSLPGRQQNGQAGSTQERAAYVAADVRNQDDVQKIAQLAIDKFGGFDT
jgi:NAD(P)-dependent dehydrogenase (short-subunit alcohol dehydrogenase family)